MKDTIVWVMLGLIGLLTCGIASAADAPTAEQEAAYAADLSKRGDGVLEALDLPDAEKAARVKQIVIDQYRGIKKIDDEALAAAPKDDKAAVAKAKEDAAAAKKPLHDAFLAKLSTELTPEQVETVKDKMTYNVVKVTYDGFQDMIPTLTDAQKGYILAQLKEAREIAMDQGSSKEKHAVFGKYKGRINNYLSKEGYDLKQATKDWAERRKARDAQAKQASTTQPAS
jgi:hypothetical protein